MAATAPITPEPRRYSIRMPHWGWFLLATVVLVVAAVGLSVWMPYHREQQVIQIIESWGGDVETEVSGAEWLRHLVGEDLLSNFDVFERVVTVFFGRQKITDTEIVQLSRLSNLQHLHVPGMLVTDAGLAPLRELRKVEILDLDNTAVTDEGLAHLRGMTKLKFLNLSETKVTDAGLADLRGLTNLRVLHLNGTAVTAEGVKELENALPDCQIVSVL